MHSGYSYMVQNSTEFNQDLVGNHLAYVWTKHHQHVLFNHTRQGRIQDLIGGGGGGADRDRPKLPTVGSSVVRVK